MLSTENVDKAVGNHLENLASSAFHADSPLIPRYSWQDRFVLS